MRIQLFNPPVSHYAGFHYKMLPLLGLPTLAAWFNLRGHQAETVDLEALAISPEEFLLRFAKQKDRWPDVVGITALTISRRGAREITKAVRAAGFAGTLVVGGVYVTTHPEEALTWGADLVVTGECEGNIIELLESGARGIHKGRPAPIEDIPAPDWRHFTPTITSYHGNMPSLLQPNPGISMFTRGCPYRCIFCSNLVFGGQPTRYRPPQNVEADMLALKTIGVQNVFVYDDEFVGTKLPDGWMKEVADRISPLDLRWLTQGRCSRRFITPKLMSDVRRAGCHTIMWGVESFSQKVLDLMDKHLTPEDVLHTLRVSKAAGIQNMVFTMIGNYGETDEDLEISTRYLKRCYDEGLIQLRQTTICTPMAGTKLGEMAAQEGWYSEQPDFGPQMLQHSPTPWLPVERMHYWQRRYDEVCPVGIC